MPVKMSRGYSKVYSRKVNSVSQASLKFDELFHENSNRPSAAKSAGTIGRWGVISCTSLRSTNINGRRDEPISSKRMRLNYGGRNTSRDPFTFDTDPDGMQSKIGPVEVKPKKFFKSRNNETPSEEIRLNASVYMGSNTYSSQGSRKYGKKPSKKFFTSAPSGEGQKVASPPRDPTPPPPPPPTREENKPPIVLRIFKGTSHLVNEGPSDGNSVIVRSSRRKNNSEPSCDFYVSTVVTKDRLSENSITAPPKKVHKESKNKECTDSNDACVLQATPENLSPPLTDVQNSDVAFDTVEEVVCSEQTSVDMDVSKNTNDVTDSLPSSLNYLSPRPSSPAQELTQQSADIVDPAVELDGGSSETEQVDSQPEMAVSDVVKSNESLLKEDEEKLLKAEELLSSTFIDFSSTAEKLLQLAPIPTVSSSPPHDPKPFLEQDFFSDSEESNSISDQINTIAACQGEDPEPEPEVDFQPLKSSESEEALPQSLPQESERTCSPATKKGSIFKSRSLLSDGSKKRRMLYKHKWADDKAGGTQPTEETALSSEASVSQPVDALPYGEPDDFQPGKLTRITTWPLASFDLGEEQEAITRVRCNRRDKGFYTVVRNVKKAHQINESGEFQEFNDDVEYILDALQDNNPIGTRCLSAITLASKCMAPAFRMHVRAHGTVAKFFRALHDATKDQSLGLCTATVMFVLSQDRLNMDLDRESLELMLNLLESDASHRNALDDCGMSSVQLHKNKQKVRELCAEIQSQGHAKHLNLDNITVGHLAMETLLSLTSRRAGEWFKEELRELGGLEHIVKTICECYGQVDEYITEWTDPLLDKLRKIDRCLRVLENVTNQNEENQLYLLRYMDGILVDTLVKLFRQCDAEIPLYPVTDNTDKESAGVVIQEALLATLRVLINLTNDFNNKSVGSIMVGERKGIVDSGLHLVLQVSKYVPEQKKFDLLVLALILLINLVEHSTANRKLLIETKAPLDPDSIFQRDKSAVQALITMFYQQEEQARAEEVKTDAILDGKKDTEEVETEAVAPKSQEEFIEETVAKLLQKAGRNMEHTLIGAYIGLLLGYLIIDNKDYETYVRQCLPEGNFKTVILVLQKVYNFMNLTASAVGSSRGIKQTERVINCLIKSDLSAESAASHAEERTSVVLDASLVTDVSTLEESIS
ncbi:protein wings apart-like [Anabrus simplex]|uniref:protein wings apart-like n=1 Tax=Anabrus simplex TaxID=316456 RepID=UPI0034DCF6B7